MFGRKMSDEWMSDFGNVIGEFRLKKQVAGLDDRQKHSCSIVQDNKSNNSSNSSRLVETQRNIKPSCFVKPNSVSKYSFNIVDEHNSDELTVDVLRDFTQKMRRRVKHVKHEAELISSENDVNTTINVTEEEKHPGDMLMDDTEETEVVACTDDEQGIHVVFNADSDVATHHEVTTGETPCDSNNDDLSTGISPFQQSMASDISGLTCGENTSLPVDIDKKMDDSPSKIETPDRTFITFDLYEETSSLQSARDDDKATSKNISGLTPCDTFRQCRVFDDPLQSTEKYQRLSSNVCLSVIPIPSTRLFQNALASRHKAKRSTCVRRTCRNSFKHTGNEISAKRNGKSVSDQCLADNKVSGMSHEQYNGQDAQITNLAKVNTDDCLLTAVHIIGDGLCNDRSNPYATGLQNSDSKTNENGSLAASTLCSDKEESKFIYTDSCSYFSFFLETEE